MTEGTAGPAPQLGLRTQSNETEGPEPTGIPELPESRSPEPPPGVRQRWGLTFGQVPQCEHAILAGQHEVGTGAAELGDRNGSGAGPHGLRV